MKSKKSTVKATVLSLGKTDQNGKFNFFPVSAVKLTSNGVYPISQVYVQAFDEGLNIVPQPKN